GSCRWYVPDRHGGRLTDFGDLVSVVREVARHDLTVAIAHGKTFLGSAPVWVAGAPEQADRVARRVSGGAAVAWGLTERGRGSDLLASAVTAVPHGGGWRLDGEKWLVNNATRGELVTVLARTDPEGGPRGLSLFLVDKRELDPGTYRCLPRERTHGIRGADISGIGFTGAALPGSALVGPVGSGVETVLKALQLTRTGCAALSLGAGDRALELTAAFVRERRLYGRALADLPIARRSLGRGAAALLLAEATATLAARLVHTHPEELSVVSAITKAFVPTVVGRALADFADLLGVRGFLPRTTAYGRFAKIERDHRIVGIFDGSTPVNRAALIAQFPRLGRRSAGEDVDLSGPLPPLDPTRLRLVSPTGCTLVAGLPSAIADVRAAAGDEVRDLLGIVESETARLRAELAGARPTREVPASAFGLAERYELAFATAAFLRSWLHGPDRDPLPLRAALTAAADLWGARPDRTAYDHLARRVLTTGGDRAQ
ncbi:acyl-CoA dehydrogenase, partial [Saccharothrix sp. MB29]|nr:acyl-CoA dehydrogenase [Saccharothrix sp. MB29]